MNDPETGPASVPQGSLGARRGGQGPVLVMLHGLFGDADNFHSVSLHFARHLYVLRLDLPGHGRSPTLASLDIEAMAHEVRQHLAAEGIEQCHLLGHSLGGKVAMSLAGQADAPALASLTIVDIAPRHYPPHHAELIAAMQAIDLATLADRRSADRALADAVPDGGVRGFLLKSLQRGDAGRFDWRFDLDGLARDYARICEAPKVAEKITVPTLFIKGGDSDYLQGDDESLIRGICTHPTLREITGAGHWLHAEKPGLFTRVVLDFIRESGLTDADSATAADAAS